MGKDAKLDNRRASRPQASTRAKATRRTCPVSGALVSSSERKLEYEHGNMIDVAELAVEHVGRRIVHARVIL
jgi:hypothetical protein